MMPSNIPMMMMQGAGISPAGQLQQQRQQQQLQAQLLQQHQLQQQSLHVQPQLSQQQTIQIQQHQLLGQQQSLQVQQQLQQQQQSLQQLQSIQQQQLGQQQSLQVLPQQQLHNLPQDIGDPVTKFRVLMTRLNDTLQKLNWATAHLLTQNVQVDSCIKNIDVQQIRFDRNFEDVYAVLDQIEINLRLAVDVLTNSSEAHRFVPAQAQILVPPQASQQGDAFTYPQYLNVIKVQLACAQEIHDTLTECVKKVGERQQGQHFLAPTS